MDVRHSHEMTLLVNVSRGVVGVAAMVVVAGCGGGDSNANSPDASSNGTDSGSILEDGGGATNDGGTPQNDSGTGLFQSKPECTGDAVTTAGGTNPQIVSALRIGAAADGLDLDHDGNPDNKMSALASMTTTPIQDALNADTLLMPLEFFNVPTVAPTACVKFAVYNGLYGTDGDADGSKASVAGGDCNDHDATIHPGATEVVGNLRDDDCDGLADESSTNVANTTETSDGDADGSSVAQGDCDDTDATVHPGAPEICGDGKDNDCDGVADRSVDGTGHVTACSAFANTADISIDAQSLDGSGDPKVSFRDGAFTLKSGTLELNAGPDPFVVHMPFGPAVGVDFPITGAQLSAAVTDQGTGFVLTSAHLGGVLDANQMDSVIGATVPQIGLTAQQTLLDAIFAGALGTTLSLPSANAKVTAKYPGCLTPDIDVDRDGLEAFCDSKAGTAGDVKKVDVCIDGDGTEIDDTATTPCTGVRDAKGNLRFVDGVSIELSFATVSIHSLKKP